MSHSVIGVLGVIVLAALQAGCAGRKIDTDRVDDIKIGMTTRAEIETWFGKPYQQARTQGANQRPVLVYTYAHVRGGYWYGRPRSHVLTVEFGENDIVVNYSFAEQGKPIR